MFIDPDRGDVLETALIVDEQATPFGQNGAVRGVPRHIKRFGDSSDRAMLTDERNETPSQRG
ncbi:hypothetical protein [Pseudoclavibacter helvolus]|uniref:hypothetical protein n=1 Tax=Pseudoclavibacter helvolus TaxID=255205 RepID=UPI001F4671DB|nr:hypothetical protein [Pseudoclavibacter helvolus]